MWPHLVGLGPCGLERKAGRGLGLGACLRPRRLDRTRRRGAGVNTSAARALVPLFEVENCGRRLEQSSDERAKGRRGEGLGGARAQGNWPDPRPGRRLGEADEALVRLARAEAAAAEVQGKQGSGCSRTWRRRRQGRHGPFRIQAMQRVGEVRRQLGVLRALHREAKREGDVRQRR